MLLLTEKADHQSSLKAGLKRSLRISGKHARQVPTEGEELPPSYEEEFPATRSELSSAITPTSDSPDSPSSSSYPPTTLTEATNAFTVSHSARAVNNVSISQPFGTIECKYIIDPTLKFPGSPNRFKRREPNIKLRTSVGTIDADLEVVSPEDPQEEVPRVLIDVASKMGTINVKLRRTVARPVVRLLVTSHAGTTTIRIPRSFQGFILAFTKLGRLSLEPPLKASASVLKSELKFTCLFVGDSSVLKDAETKFSWHGIWNGDGGWKGDEIMLQTSVGNMDVGFVEDCAVCFSTEHASGQCPSASEHDDATTRENGEESTRDGRRRGRGGRRGHGGRGTGSRRGRGGLSRNSSSSSSSSSSPSVG
ncbi:hypothetical protein BT96DRAFT_720964 [Gymnopus androsaceus JB14]|uniref:DUF7330 domain-containing protein n=1 Tax=Gymnopus androsaceus JB14 TaxID=1447944 RepID=A0A6A4HME0_9AGAR|nr:hypothetical protein BT96DRAFT_720964 [Gymnopus androsaceus JB14]